MRCWCLVIAGIVFVPACKEETPRGLPADHHQGPDATHVRVGEPARSAQPLVLARLTSQLANGAGGHGPLGILDEIFDAAVVPPFFEQRAKFKVPPAGGTLAFRYTLTGGGAKVGKRKGCVRGAQFQITLEAAGASNPPPVIYEDELVERMPWVSKTVDLSKWSGEDVTARFRMSYLSAPRRTCAGTNGVWADVHLVGLTKQHKPRERLPNIWIVVVDTLRHDALGHIGGPMAASTPRMDKLARASYRFKNAWSTAPWTLVSMISLLTGEYYHMGMEDYIGVSQTSWPEGHTSIAEHLQKGGYRTFGMVANPYMNLPIFLRGFDGYFVIHHDNEQRIIDLLPGFLDDRRAGQPKFIYLHLMAPHLPYCFHKGITERYLKEASIKGEVKGCDEIDRDMKLWTDRSRRLFLPLYKGEVEVADRMVGKILDIISKEDKRADNWVFLTSDHGEELLDHGGFEHGHTLYEELLQVPLLIRPPVNNKQQTAPQALDAPVSLVDIAHTVAELARLKPLDTRGGRSLIGAMRGDKIPPGRTRLASGPLYGDPRYAIRTGGLKRIWTNPKMGGTFEEFDLQKDPKEQDPVRRVGEGAGSIPYGELGMFQQLAGSGWAIVRIQFGSVQDGPMKLRFRFDGEVELLTRKPEQAGLRLTSTKPQGTPLWELTRESGDAGEAYLQLKGIHERTGWIEATIEQRGRPVASSKVSWPYGTELLGNKAKVPTPWDNYNAHAVERKSPAVGEICISWHWPQVSGASTPNANKDLIKRLKSLGYIQ